MMSESRIIGGKYELGERLGKGGAGSVYRVYDVKLDKIWAAKRVKKENPGMEERILGKVDGKLFPRIVDVVEERNDKYLVMDWIDGETLAQRLEKRGEFSGREAAETGIAICDALQALHEMQPTLLYLDCKPSNIMVDKDGRLWLIDFGSAVECEEMNAVPIAASPGYAAPEQCAADDSRRSADVRSDVFGLGRTLYALLGGPDPGRPPYGACRISVCNPKAPAKLVKIVERCMEVKPEQRFQTIQAVKDALAEFLEEEKPFHCAGPGRKAVTWLLLLLTVWRARIFYGLTGLPQKTAAEAVRALFWMVASACAAACWRRFAVEKDGRGGLACETVYSIVRTQKKAGKWLLALMVGLSALAAPALLGSVRAKELSKTSPVMLRDGQMRRLLVRDGAVLRTWNPVYMEINPSLFETQEELEIKVTARGCDSGLEYEYALRYCPAPEEGE